MSDQITKILIRKGLNSDRETITLDEAELGYTTDYKRVFVGDGTTEGGNVISNLYLGEVNLTSNASTLANTANYGDFLFDTSDSTFSVLTGSDNTNKDSYLKVSNTNKGTVTQVNVGAGLIVDNASEFLTTTGTINLKLDETNRTVLSKSNDGLLLNLNVLYPTHSVLFTDNNVNPTDPNGILEGSGQTWVSFGELTTSTGSTIYTWLRAG